MKLQEKLVCTVMNDFVGNGKTFTVTEAHNTTRFLPGTHPTEVEIGVMIGNGVSVVLKRK